VRLEQTLLDRIKHEFAEAHRATVVDSLNNYAGPEAARVARDILQLSKGSVEQVADLVKAANRDYRDIIYWAEYAADDPLMRSRDPKQVADQLIQKWGDKK
jgi:hypothetical protein